MKKNERDDWAEMLTDTVGQDFWKNCLAKKARQFSRLRLLGGTVELIGKQDENGNAGAGLGNGARDVMA